ncbi:hypothetical protein UFOVP916_28 [uncultured Caudovirales phage]|uniref:Uncharacterized protein n=1 Tax=uncultured Caudovirales phage TaxID=2100421 RepID=A0A6J5RY82_9CAUD|nr:hypothetical protein UFOVP827_49 [uncultured Caudovirales phage]CAB4171457.1 hypothetical protein UFOVP916_28 [uncultured Caudovirales phage]CAB4177446.1 hypothetical protein UFOVP1001_52 [uncultured Caudovirales phage]CAB4199176.1 hypothetical protein UFOVP1338_24 [uncultured Caudovirales phage]CAB4213381.1 hypothetical protein UFOVP1447_19 [uncultured Caudovirales phage]
MKKVPQTLLVKAFERKAYSSGAAVCKCCYLRNFVHQRQSLFIALQAITNQNKN